MPVLMMLSREVRRVPLDYEHPKRSQYSPIKMAYVESFQPGFDAFYVPTVRAWLSERDEWIAGKRPTYYRHESGETEPTFEEYHGNGPDPDYYHPGEAWPEGAELGVCMYESVTEGTPISATYPDTTDGRVAMANELATGEHGITTGLSVQDWLGVITDQISARDITTGELS